MSDDDRSVADREFERRVRELFDASVARVDAPARSRLNRSRQRALDIAAGERRLFRVWRTGFAAGAVAATVLVAVLLWRGPDEAAAPAPGAQVAAETSSPALELVSANDEDLRLAAAEEDLDFYAWVEAAGPTAQGSGAGET
ncbi:MAG TPA: hypothetical protein VF851_04160 [Steroidobacteraceae bacterium]